VVASHVRSLMAEHLTDKPSGKNHEVKPWFQGKLDFTPPVWNLSDHGFMLKGGRLDYLGGRAAAALVYRRRLHTINLLIWRDPGAADAAPEALTRQGYHLVRWAQGGLAFWAVSDLNAGELREFAELVRRQPPQ
jgi:anti-sigma factor RsiW